MDLLKSSEYTFTNYHIMSYGFTMLYVKDMFQIVVSLHCFWTLQVLWLIVKTEKEKENIVLKVSYEILRLEAYILFACDQSSIRLKTIWLNTDH